MDRSIQARQGWAARSAQFQQWAAQQPRDTPMLTEDVTGGSLFGARLTAVMLVHGVTHILTFNDDDFRRYAPWGIIAVHPNSL